MEATALSFFIACVTAAGFGIAIAAFGCGLGQGIGLKSAVEGIARNPESSGKVTVTLLIGLAMIESLCIYALVVSLILIYPQAAHPQAAAFLIFISPNIDSAGW
jgi:F-type H+-transporting ATPase subunit c